MAKELHYGSWDGHRLRAGTFIADVKSYPIGEHLEFTVARAMPHKTTQQNRYLHQLFTIAARALSEATGQNYTKERVKAYAKKVELYPVEDFVNPKTGEITQIAMDTRDLSKEDCMITIDRMIAHFAEIGIILPSPNEQQHMQL